MEQRKTSPRDKLLGFKTDAATFNRIQNGAKEKGVPVSKYLHDIHQSNNK
jgi:hypothetical protein